MRRYAKTHQDHTVSLLIVLIIITVIIGGMLYLLWTRPVPSDEQPHNQLTLEQLDQYMFNELEYLIQFSNGTSEDILDFNREPITSDTVTYYYTANHTSWNWQDFTELSHIYNWTLTPNVSLVSGSKTVAAPPASEPSRPYILPG